MKKVKEDKIEDILNHLKGILPAQSFECFGKENRHIFFRINTLKSDKQDVMNWLKPYNCQIVAVEDFPNVIGILRQEAKEIMDSALVKEGKLYPQGLESMQAVLELDPQPGEKVLDLCAAPGSKTSQIAALMKNEGELVANEPIRERFYRLKSVLALTGAKATLTMVDGRCYRLKDKPFDRILIDAPCSSEGRFKYHEPKSYEYWSLRKIKEMAHKQKGLLLNASRLIKPGGVLVYSTCTFSKEENQEAVEWLNRKNGELQLELTKQIFPDGRMEGFFIAKWTKI